MSRNSLRTKNSETKKPTFESLMKGGIVVLCTLFATFSFEAALNPPGGLWQDWPPSNITNATEIAKAANLTRSRNFRVQNFLLKLLQQEPIPQLDFSAPDLYGPGKAMNIALAPYEFVCYLALDTMCFSTSLLTIAVLTFSTIKANLWSIIAMVGVELTVLFAFGLYSVVLAMVANKQFAEWALKIGITQSLWFAIILVVGAAVIAYVSAIIRKMCCKRNMGEVV